MMSSVIPARLTFQCGHAALVTLPRVKGETATQRNQRVAFEKNAALARQCDFCGPSVQVAAPTLLSEVIASHATTADLLAAEPVVAAAPKPEPVVAAAPEPETEPVAVEPEPVPSIAEPEPAATPPEPEPAAPVAEPAPRAVAVKAAQVITQAAQAPHVNGVAKHTTRRRRTGLQNYVVRYRLERVVKAADIRDALRVATGFGAADIVAISRER